MSPLRLGIFARRIQASNNAPIAPMAPDSVGVAIPVMMVPSTKKMSTAEGMMPMRHFFQRDQPLSVNSPSGAGGKSSGRMRAKKKV